MEVSKKGLKMLAKTITCSLNGMNSEIINVETIIRKGFPSFSIVGLPGTSIMESRERIWSAMISTGLKLGPGKIIVNLYPADERKEGTQWDLPIAISLAHALGKIPEKKLREAAFIGELGLDGSVRSVIGCFHMAMTLIGKVKRIYLPYEQGETCQCIKGIDIIPVKNLKEIIEDFQGGKKLSVLKYREAKLFKDDEAYVDYINLRGQTILKRIMVIASLGRHSVLLIGPPGVGKSMAINSIRGIVPDLSNEEVLELARIRSINSKAGKELFNKNIPFRSPHYSISRASLIGGGAKIMPGEISLAHKGILFLDEISFFSQACLESLRTPMDHKSIVLTRNHKTVEFPADFQLLAATNSCPCGYRGDPNKQCKCTNSEILRYINRISQALLDRFDIVFNVQSIDWKKADSDGISSSIMKGMVEEALSYKENLDKSNKIKSKLSKNIIDRQGEKLIKRIAFKYGLSARSINSLIRLAETIMFLNQKIMIGEGEIAEALQYKRAAWSFRDY